jgi:hypothetical protein
MPLRLVRHCFRFVGRAAIVLLKAVFLTVTGFRKLKVDAVTANESFLISNGLAHTVILVKTSNQWV